MKLELSTSYLPGIAMVLQELIGLNLGEIDFACASTPSPLTPQPCTLSDARASTDHVTDWLTTCDSLCCDPPSSVLSTKSKRISCWWRNLVLSPRRCTMAMSCDRPGLHELVSLAKSTLVRSAPGSSRAYLCQARRSLGPIESARQV